MLAFKTECMSQTRLVSLGSEAIQELHQPGQALLDTRLIVPSKAKPEVAGHLREEGLACEREGGGRQRSEV